MAEFDLGAAFIPKLYKPAALLPIAKHHDTILYVIETYPVTIVVGQTGSGKTTQIPQFLEQAGWCADGKVIAVTQVCRYPRPLIKPSADRHVAQARRSHDCCPEGGRGVWMRGR